MMRMEVYLMSTSDYIFKGESHKNVSFMMSALPVKIQQSFFASCCVNISYYVPFDVFSSKCTFT